LGKPPIKKKFGGPIKKPQRGGKTLMGGRGLHKHPPIRGEGTWPTKKWGGRYPFFWGGPPKRTAAIKGIPEITQGESGPHKRRPFQKKGGLHFNYYPPPPHCASKYIEPTHRCPCKKNPSKNMMGALSKRGE